MASPYEAPGIGRAGVAEDGKVDEDVGERCSFVLRH